VQQLAKAIGAAVDAVEEIISSLRKTLGGILDGPPPRTAAASG
jgi:hypothetical protein